MSDALRCTIACVAQSETEGHGSFAEFGIIVLFQTPIKRSEKICQIFLASVFLSRHFLGGGGGCVFCYHRITRHLGCILGIYSSFVQGLTFGCIDILHFSGWFSRTFGIHLGYPRIFLSASEYVKVVCLSFNCVAIIEKSMTYCFA